MLDSMQNLIVEIIKGRGDSDVVRSDKNNCFIDCIVELIDQDKFNSALAIIENIPLSELLGMASYDLVLLCELIDVYYGRGADNVTVRTCLESDNVTIYTPIASF